MQRMNFPEYTGFAVLLEIIIQFICALNVDISKISHALHSYSMFALLSLHLLVILQFHQMIRLKYMIIKCCFSPFSFFYCSHNTHLMSILISVLYKRRCPVLTVFSLRRFFALFVLIPYRICHGNYDYRSHQK